MQQRGSAITLPKALENYMRYPLAWGAIQKTLHPSEDTDKRKKHLSKIDKNYFCTITRKLMYDPILVRGKVYERESYLNWHKKTLGDTSSLHIVYANKIRENIIALIDEHPELRNIQYLPVEFINHVTRACMKGDVESLKALQKIDPRLLLTPHPVTKLLPLHQAVVNDASLSTMIQLLDEQQKGMALACLLQPNADGKLFIETAIRIGSPLLTILKIMSWMGNTLRSVLIPTLPPEAKPLLNDILFIALLRGNVMWVEKALSFGADFNANPDNNPEFLALADQLADPDIKARLFSALPLRKIDQALTQAGNEEDYSIGARLNGQPTLRVIKEDQGNFAETAVDHNQLLKIEKYLTSRTMKELKDTVFPPVKPQPVTVLAGIKPEDVQLPLSLVKDQCSLPEEITPKTVCSSRFFPGGNQLAAFLNAVIEDDQKAVGQILESKPHMRASLLLREKMPINLKDGNSYSITAYQYTLLVGNEGMSDVLLKYLKAPEAFAQQQQLSELKKLKTLGLQA